MIAGKISIIGLVLAALSMSANAESKRYLVKFKSAEAFKSVATNVQRARIGLSDSSGPVKLMNTKANVNEALEKVELLVVQTDDAKAIESLRNHPAIELVEEEIMHPAPKQISTHGFGARLLSIAAPPAMDIPWGINAVKAADAWGTTRGGGARVMVLDTGMDDQHISLVSRFEKGRNFAGADVNDITDNVGHGSHVAGTVLADGAAGGLIGVAPEARLLMGKVCEINGCSSVAIASGIDWAITEKVDVINMSLGGFFISAGERQALDRAEAQGVVVIAASGNSGTASVSYPAAYGTVLAVGALDSTLTRADFSQYGPELDIMGPGVDVISAVPRGTGRGATVKVDVEGKGLTVVASTPFVGAPLTAPSQREVVFAGLGKATDFTGLNVTGKFALISRGEITFKEKVQNAINAGAAGAIIYNNAPGLLQGGLTEDGSEVAIPAAMIEQSVGEALRAALAGGGTPSAVLSIDATDFAAFAGTSMASPHVAGVAALIRAANKNLTPAQVREILTGTATALGAGTTGNQYGSGIVNAGAAVARALSLSSSGNGVLLKAAN